MMWKRTAQRNPPSNPLLSSLLPHPHLHHTNSAQNRRRACQQFLWRHRGLWVSLFLLGSLFCSLLLLSPPFMNSSAVRNFSWIRSQVSLPSVAHINRSLVWMAPFFSGGGYCTEAISFVMGLDSRNVPIQIVHQGDDTREDFMSGLGVELHDKLIYLSKHVLDTFDAIAICHSLPSVWTIPHSPKPTPEPKPEPSPEPSIEPTRLPRYYKRKTGVAKIKRPPKINEPECASGRPNGWPEDADCPPLPNAYAIGRTMFETDSIFEEWTEACNAMDEIWVPTQFNKETFIRSGVAASKVVVIPEAVDTEFFDPDTIRPFQSIYGCSTPSDCHFKFLSVFKWEARKGWDVLLKAFFSEFSPADKVSLYILTHVDAPIFEAALNNITATLQLDTDNLPQLYLLEKHLSHTEFPRLYKSVDAFVLPSHGEGWGRPVVEAMSMGLPVLVTNWSGPTEYMTEENSFPIPIEGLVPASDAWFRNQLWAQPSQHELQKLMRWVVNNPKRAKKKGLQARRDMIAKWHPDKITDMIFERLMAIDAIIQTRNITRCPPLAQASPSPSSSADGSKT